MMRCTTMVHVAGLGADISPSEGRIHLPTALRPFVRGLTESGHATDTILGGCQLMLRERPAMPPVTAILTPHGPTRSLQLAVTARQAVDSLICAQAFANDFRGRPDSHAALQHMHLMAERMLGKTSGVEDAKRKPKACILRLHPDRCRGLLRIEGRHFRYGKDEGIVDMTELARKTLLQGYIELLHAIERPEIGPYITGNVAFTARQAVEVIMLAAEQRIGRSGAWAAACGAILAAAALTGLAIAQMMARRWWPYALLYGGAALVGWHSGGVERRLGNRR